MIKTIFKSILWGTAIGAILFFAGPFILVVLLLKFIFTPFGMWRYRGPRYAYAGRGWGGGSHYADKIRSMSEDEYQAFKTKSEGRFAHCRNNFNQ